MSESGRDPRNPGADAPGDQATRRGAERITVLEGECAALRRLIDSASAFAIVTLDQAGRVTDWNEGAVRLLGHGRAAVLGRAGDGLLAPESPGDGGFARLLCAATEAGQAALEAWVPCRDGGRLWASGIVTPLSGPDGQAAGFLLVFRDATAQRMEAERQALLQAEMGHRVKNALATAQAVAAQTLRHAGVAPAVQQVLVRRLMALAGSHDQLLAEGWRGAVLTEVVARVLEPYRRVTAAGPPVRLPAQRVELLSLALHELSTNAAKYGALSVPEGQVALTWALRWDEAGRQVEILWRESGGPPVQPPRNQGFGSRLLQRGLLQRSGGTIALDFRPAGVECRMVLPVAAP